jgi:hypothetical protein
MQEEEDTVSISGFVLKGGYPTTRIVLHLLVGVLGYSFRCGATVTRAATRSDRYRLLLLQQTMKLKGRACSKVGSFFFQSSLFNMVTCSLWVHMIVLYSMKYMAATLPITPFPRRDPSL